MSEMSTARIVFAVALAVALAGGGVLAAGPNWAQWRGPGSAGVSDDAALPTVWSPASHVAWKTPIPGRSHSSPIVWGDHLFVTTAIEGAVIPGHVPLKHFDSGQEWRSPDAVAGDLLHTFQVLALDASTGKILWTRTAYEGPVYDDRHRKGSYAAPTPVTDGVRVYAYFGSEGLYAYNFDGTLAWKTTLGKIATMSVGLSTSPVLFDGLVIIQADEDTGTSSFIAAVDAVTGKERWRVARPGMSISWGTPVVSTAGGRAQLITAANERIVSYDPPDENCGARRDSTATPCRRPCWPAASSSSRLGPRPRRPWRSGSIPALENHGAPGSTARESATSRRRLPMTATCT
jgi:outer membrane protein assembly factor BamB